ncbi:HNH endonuclease signature motif containing protein [Streptomyces sp. NPDC052687]|uniref:HNH endonuclease n=1 Tax=Streptomyces sp. NPDC052687 TaxID=3154759 RepID=UPI00343AB947
MTPARLAPPTNRRTTAVDRTVAGSRPSAVRSVPRPMRTTPSLRSPEPPLHPSRRDVLRRWEELDEWSCAYCDAAFGQTVVAEVDHVRPLAGGGVHEWFNLVLACGLCNGMKSDLSVADWLSKTTGESLTDGTQAAT